MKRTYGALIAGTAFIAATAQAAETITYTYDVHGRLVEVLRGGGANDGLLASYQLDRADNRLRLTVKDSSSPSFGVADASAAEGSSLAFVVRKSGSAAGDIQLSYATANGDAVAGATGDYSAASGTLTFGSTESSKTILVATRSDGADENTETMKLTLASATGGAAITDAQATGTIQDLGDNRAPAAVGDEFDVGACSTGPTTLNVLANDGDPDGDTITLFDVAPATRGTAEEDGSTVAFTPPGFMPARDGSFSYEIQDSRGARDTATVTVNFTNNCATNQ